MAGRQIVLSLEIFKTQWLLTPIINVNKSHHRLLTPTMVVPKIASLQKSMKHDHLGLYTEGRQSTTTKRLGLGLG